MPGWNPDTVNGSFAQDDLYVDMTFLRTLEVYGLDVSIRQAGIDFANSGYPLWHANFAGRTVLRKESHRPTRGIRSSTPTPTTLTTRSRRISPAWCRPGCPTPPSRWSEVR